jgi:type I restriction enzyme R subunit
MYKRRTDLIGFVNGLPLIFIELKAAHKNVRDAYDNNLKDYKDTIPQLFWYNTFIILSNGAESKMGSVTSGFEHFNEWKKINSEGEKGIVSLETIVKGICDKERFLDIFENFIIFSNEKGGLIKIVSRNHQYLGVNNAIESLKKVKENEEERGKLGVFWHTQGSGKSYSMLFFAQKVLRKFEGNYTFLIVTDRQELDGQIYKNFQNAGAVLEPEEKVHAKSIEHLRELLQEDHRNIFTLIQKFQFSEDEKEFPCLSERSDIIVMTDEAHRSQYDLLALNMRNALPKANFIGFTGTPLIEEEEEETKKTFGDYVSIYNFRQSVEDGATVPLYYENRIPTLQMDKEKFNEDLSDFLEITSLNEDEEKKLDREFSREYHLITREDRLNTIAKDVMEHFNNRGDNGKALFVCIDRLTAVKMYNKLKAQPNCPDVAVVISGGSNQNEVEYFSKHGLDVVPHRTRMIQEDLETKFKDPNDPLRIVIVCSMWLTGFDVEVLSTIYLDKPMKNHTLMQTIARANRVFPGKNNGLIVDYIGVFRNLQKALSVYAIGPDGEKDMPIIPKEKLVEELEKALEEGKEFTEKYRVGIQEIIDSEELNKIKLIEEAVDIFLISEDIKNQYLNISNKIVKLFGAILPDRRANDYYQVVKTYRVLADRIRAVTKKDINVDEIADKIEKMLDDSIEAEGYEIRSEGKVTDLSKINFEKLREVFDKGQKHKEAEQLKQAIEKKLKKMIKQNPIRLEFAEKLENLIAEYNTGARTVEEFFKMLVEFAQELNEEEKRTVKESLSEEQMAVFDLLCKEDLSEKEKKQVKKIAKDIIGKLKEENLLCLDWRKKQQARAQVKEAITDVLYEDLPESYDKELLQMKLELVFQHVYDSYVDVKQNVYI